MVNELGEWQQRLATHFTALQERRAKSGGGPVFALEHGLAEAEIQTLSAAVRAHIARERPSILHSLVWVVYAAEIGYIYVGDEYWQTFEEQTRGWTTHGDRGWLRDRYVKFHEKYGGAKPTGQWAEHFSIICWPIAHAVLPRDLQRQLARILYDLRHSFSAELFESPVALGELVASLSWSASSRFQNLAQDTQLLGQISAALLLDDGLNGESLLHASTLKRITEDLDRERRGREWLRSARQVAKERARVRGVALIRPTPAQTTIRRSDEARNEVVTLGIEPRLVLRPADPLSKSWNVVLEIPDLSHLLIRFPSSRDVLTGSRCNVAGAAGRPLARGRCLHGAQRVVLNRWPSADCVLLEFEKRNTQLDFLLRAECLLRPGPRWLFRIASDGLAYECRSPRVRPGERYILVSTDLITPGVNARETQLGCEKVHGIALNLPKALDSDWELTLRSLGLSQSKTIEVWPAGLAAINWDGEGHGEWLASERPCLAVSTDHAADRLFVAVGADSLELAPVRPGEAMFVELPRLPIGLHKVRFAAKATSSGISETLGVLDVLISIRAVRPWSPGISAQGPLAVHVEPLAPTLEQLWEGVAEITLLGPKGRTAKCKVALFEKEGAAATFSKQLPAIALPMTEQEWNIQWQRHVKDAPKAQSAYDAAHVCELEFDAEELGAFSLRCERSFTPLRWATKSVGRDKTVVRLLNDSGNEDVPVVTRFAFESPLTEEKLESLAEFTVPKDGGLYIAQAGKTTAGTIAAPKVTTLADLRCTPRIQSMPHSVDSVLQLLSAIRLWGKARLPGDPISAKRQRDVLESLTAHMFGVIGGDGWTKAEARARDQDRLNGLEDAISRRREEVAIGIVLARDCADLANATCHERVIRLGSLASRYFSFNATDKGTTADSELASSNQYASPEWMAELALRLASGPIEVEEWAGSHLGDGAQRLMESLPTLARAARFLVLAIDRHLRSNGLFGELYAGWRWS